MEDTVDGQLIDLLGRLGYENEEKQLITKVYRDGSSTEQDMNLVTDHILRAGISNQNFSSDAAKLCSIFIAAEKKSSEESRFRTLLLTKLQEQYCNIKLSRDDEIELTSARWVAFVSFLGSVFRHVRIDGKPMRALVAPMLECLSKLAFLGSATNANQELAQCITSQLQMHGRELEMQNEIGMAELFCDIREMLLSGDITQFSRLMLLEIIEFRANNWTLSPSANDYYYNNIK